MKILSGTLFFLLISLSSFAQSGKDFERDIKQYFEVSGSRQIFLAAVDQMVETFKGLRTEIPDDIWDKIGREFKTTSVEELFDRLVPVYKAHFTHQEIKEFITFYQSDAGRKLARKGPVLSQESSKVGQQWGAEIGERLGKKLEEEGY